MALFRFKRKKSSGNTGVTLIAGEPYYNLEDKQLYIGDSDNQSIGTSKKHIAQITAKEVDSENVVSFQIGENSSNVYRKVISAESLSGTIENAKYASSAGSAVNVTGQINGKNLSSIFESDNITVKKATHALTADNAGIAWKKFNGEKE